MCLTETLSMNATSTTLGTNGITVGTGTVGCTIKGSTVNGGFGTIAGIFILILCLGMHLLDRKFNKDQE